MIFVGHMLRKKQDVIFEIGTEEQTGSNNTAEELEHTLECMKKFCQNNKLPFPTFIVIQAGTRVMETKNIDLLILLLEFKMNFLQKYKSQE